MTQRNVHQKHTFNREWYRLFLPTMIKSGFNEAKLKPQLMEVRNNIIDGKKNTEHNDP